MLQTQNQRTKVVRPENLRYCLQSYSCINGDHTCVWLVDTSLCSGLKWSKALRPNSVSASCAVKHRVQSLDVIKERGAATTAGHRQSAHRSRPHKNTVSNKVCENRRFLFTLKTSWMCLRDVLQKISQHFQKKTKQIFAVPGLQLVISYLIPTVNKPVYHCSLSACNKLHHQLKETEINRTENEFDWSAR